MKPKTWYGIGIVMAFIGGLAQLVGSIAQKKADDYLITETCNMLEEKYGLTPKDEEEED